MERWSDEMMKWWKEGVRHSQAVGSVLGDGPRDVKNFRLESGFHDDDVDLDLKWCFASLFIIIIIIIITIVIRHIINVIVIINLCLWCPTTAIILLLS